jgi:thiamine monophosphate synthase
VTSPLPRLIVVTDRHQAESAGHELWQVVFDAIDAGARAVLLREKDLGRVERIMLASAIGARLAPAGGMLLVSEDGAHVQVPATGFAGKACHSVDDLFEAAGWGFDYATLSPVWETPSKPGYGPALGLDGLAAACAAVPDLPIVALGGVIPGRAAACLDAGAAGVAVMGAIMTAPDPGAVVRGFLTEMGETVAT